MILLENSLVGVMENIVAIVEEQCVLPVPDQLQTQHVKNMIVVNIQYGLLTLFIYGCVPQGCVTVQYSQQQ